MSVNFSFFCIIFAFIFLGGCANMTDYSRKSAVEIEKAVVVKDSDYDSHVKIFAPQLRSMKEMGLLTGYDYEYYSLRGWKDKKSGGFTNQLYITIMYKGGWRFYQTASFEGGRQSDLTDINRDVVNCIAYETMGTICDYSETIGLLLSDAFLKEHETSGFTVRINSKSSHENILKVSGEYIKGYLKAISKLK